MEALLQFLVLLLHVLLSVKQTGSFFSVVNVDRRSIALQQDPGKSQIQKQNPNHQTSVVESDRWRGPLRQQICNRGVKVCGKCPGVVGQEQAVLVYYSTMVGFEMC